MDKILFVDDDPLVLQGYQRQLRKIYQVDVAEGGAAGLDVLQSKGPFALVVSDYRMPGMDGVQFLRKVKDVAPDTVRMMLSGQADFAALIEAVNEGSIFRFLNKPCSSEVLTNALQDGVRQYQLIRAEKELLEHTLSGSLKALADVLALVNPEAFGKASRIKRYVAGLAEYLGLPDRWRLDVAASLSQIGSVVTPHEILAKVEKGESLTPLEEKVFNLYPSIGADLLRSIPRLEEVTKSIEYQLKHFDGTGLPETAVKGEDIPIEARLLKVAIDFDSLRSRNVPRSEAFKELQTRTGWYDPKILAALNAVFVPEQRFQLVSLELSQLEPNMVVAEAITDKTGKVLVAKGQLLTEWMVSRLKELTNRLSLKQTIQIIKALDSSDPEAEGSSS